VGHGQWLPSGPRGPLLATERPCCCVREADALVGPLVPRCSWGLTPGPGRGSSGLIAILTVLVRLGLRAGEVAGLGLDDIDRRRGLITVRGKGNRHGTLVGRQRSQGYGGLRS
jgi:hypothetical protein